MERLVLRFCIRPVSGAFVLLAIMDIRAHPLYWSASKPDVTDGEVGPALLYPAREWSVCAPGHHGYPHASALILGKALRGRLGHQITDATARPFLHLLNPARRPR